MRSASPIAAPSRPALLAKSETLATYVKSLSTQQLAQCMHVTLALAAKTHQIFADWNSLPQNQSLAIDSFLGDIYSGLQAGKLTDEDRAYANQHLYILSGLYGVLRPLDGVMPYRLEMGYTLADEPFRNLYKFWGEDIARHIPAKETIVNLAAVEYSKAVLPYIDSARVITPKFLTRHPKTGEPTFVVVHAKIARGAFARWLITQRLQEAGDALHAFSDIGYAFAPELSTTAEPVFICNEFGGKGLSIRLEK